MGWNEAAKKFEQNPRYTWREAGFEQTDHHPVVNVSWNDAVAFAEWLGKKEGKTYRLPTEAEWEYACRAGTTTRYFCGDDPEGLAEVGNIADATAREKYPDWNAIAARDGFVYTAPVGRYRPNAWGLHDMHGNVWEWCWDWYGKDFYKASRVDDPAGPLEAADRVIRGGGWSAARATAGRRTATGRARRPELRPGLPPGPSSVREQARSRQEREKGKAEPGAKVSGGRRRSRPPEPERKAERAKMWRTRVSQLLNRRWST